MYCVATLIPVSDSQVPPEPSGQYSLAGVQLTSLCWVCGGKMEPALDMCSTCRVHMEEGGGRDWLSKKLGLKETSVEDGRGAGAGMSTPIVWPPRTPGGTCIWTRCPACSTMKVWPTRMLSGTWTWTIVIANAGHTRKAALVALRPYAERQRRARE